MPEWFSINPPPHRVHTELRLVCTRERRPGHRIHVESYDGERWVYSQFYDRDRWEGHCGGILLMPDFLATAEEHARYFRLTPEEQGFLTYMQGKKNPHIPQNNPYMHRDERYAQWNAGQQRAIIAVIDLEGA